MSAVPAMLARLDLRAGVADGDADLRTLLAPPPPEEAPLAAVREIIADVRARGDDAVRELTARFDGCAIDDLRVPESERNEALASAPPAFREALEFARARITAYHRTQLPAEVRHEGDGIVVREEVRPVERAGLYVPGGRAAYPSTVLMTAIPAQVAGVPELALCVPPDAEGRVPAPTLAAAALLGIEEVYRVGGAQAIAALAHGTATIRPVDVVVGPGNLYVTLAKREVLGVVGIDTLAGPSELVVVADDSTPVDLVAIDLVAQAEHGPGGKAVVVTWSEALADALASRVLELTAESPRRAEVEATMRSGGQVVLVDGPQRALEVVNVIAPEHLELMTADPEALVPMVRNAGAVFCGWFAPAAVGDYVAGVNHVLPTGRAARYASALRVTTFLKHLHVVGLDEGALARVAPYVSVFAEVEGLDAHGRSVRMRRATAAGAFGAGAGDRAPA